MIKPCKTRCCLPATAKMMLIRIFVVNVVFVVIKQMFAQQLKLLLDPQMRALAIKKRMMNSKRQRLIVGDVPYAMNFTLSTKPGRRLSGHLIVYSNVTALEILVCGTEPILLNA